ncbi:MAG: hypothetical protein FIB01_04925 [Gemmatimonadetes bacterium]|nr:hypothetical protein [Gemmatimonadota bacterium]
MPDRFSPHPLHGFALCGALALAGCAKDLTSERAAELIAARFPPDTIEWTTDAGWPRALEALAAQGWIQYSAGDDAPTLSLTPAGEQHGLRLTRDSLAYGGVRLTGRLCTLAVDSVGSITALERPGVRAAETRFTRRYLQPTALFDWLSRSPVYRDECPPAKVHEGTATFLADGSTWRLNQAPAFPAQAQVQATTNFSRDSYGRLNGAAYTFEVATPATDADGDSLSYRWVGRYYPGEGDKLLDMELMATGLRASWPGLVIMGEPAGGVVMFIAEDTWGATDTVRICIEGGSFGC